MATTSVIRYRFESDTAQNINFSVPRANPAVDDAIVGASMDNMITGGIILTKQGRPVKKIHAQLVTTTRTRYDF